MGQFQSYSINSNESQNNANLEYFNTVGKRLRKLREDRGMTQSDLGKLLRYNQDAVSKKELGRLQISSHEIVVISQALHLSSHEVLYLLFGVKSE